MMYSATIIVLAASLVSAQTYDKNWSSTNGKFEISTKNQSDATFEGSVTLPSCDTNPVITLNNGVLIDQDNRQAEVVANHQFQFDSPLQDQRIYVDGFSIITDASNKNNITLAHPAGSGNSNTFYSCNSGDFSNLYDSNIDGKCVPIFIQILPCGPTGPASAGGKPGDQAAGGATSTGATSAVASTSASSTPASSSASTTAAVTSAAVASPSTVASVPTHVPVPYPTGNATTPHATGTGSPSSTAPGSSTSSPLTAPASGAEALVIGSKFGAVAAALIAFAML